MENEQWKSILIIDDDESHLKMARQILITNGFSALTASTGEEGLTIAEAQKPDLILLDVIMPGIKGRDVCKRIKENEATKDIPVVFLTAKDSEDDIAAEREAGASAHLTKPIDGKAMISTIKEILTDA